MENLGAIVGGIAGFIFGGPTGAMIGAGIGSTYYDQPIMAEKSFEAQTGGAKQKAIAEGRELAIQRAPISAEQMKMVMGAREIEDLVRKFNEQDRTEPVIYTLPTAEPTSPVERINRAIADFFRK